MFLLNLKIAFRNLFKNKLYAFINMGGLAMGMLSFILISLYINYEKSFDQWDAGLKRVYNVRSQFSEKIGSFSNLETVPEPAFELFQQKAKNIAAIGLMDWSSYGSVKYHQHTFDNLSIVNATPDFLKTYFYKSYLGDLYHALQHNDDIVLSKTFAKKVFGDSNPLGKVIELGLDKDKKIFTVRAVWDNQVCRSYFDFDAVYLIQKNKYDRWNNFSKNCYVQLNAGADKDSVFNQLTRLYLDGRARFSQLYPQDSATMKKANTDQLLTIKEANDILKANSGSEESLSFVPVSELHLYNSDRQKALLILQGLSFLLMLIGCINFTNLSIVQASARAKEVGMRKVLGGKKPSLIVQFLMESFLPCFFALFIALVAAELLLPTFNQMIDSQLSLYDVSIMPRLILQILLLLLMIILIAGLYPALFISSFAPAKVLKGNFNRSTKGIWIRKILVIIQFGIAALFLMCFMVMRSQNQFLMRRDKGVEVSNLVSIKPHYDRIKKMNTAQFISLQHRLEQIKGVKNVSSMSGLSLFQNGYSTATIKYKKQDIQLLQLQVKPDILPTMGMKILQGRGFSNTTLANDTARYVFRGDTVQNVMITELTVKSMDLDKPYIDQVFENNGNKVRVVAVVKDFSIYGKGETFKPAVMYYNTMANYNYLDRVLIRLDGQQNAKTMAQIKTLWEREIEPETLFEYTYADELLQRAMRPYTRLATIMLLFSIVTFIITLLGIFALAAYTARMRTREIAVRRVMGASVQDILLLLNKDFIRLTLIGSAIAIVAAYLLMQKWLAQFAYRIDMPYWIFVCVALLLLLVTIITVTLQGIQSARTKPVTALSYE